MEEKQKEELEARSIVGGARRTQEKWENEVYEQDEQEVDESEVRRRMRGV